MFHNILGLKRLAWSVFAQKKASFQMGLFNEKKSVYLISCLLAMLNNCMVKEQFQNKKGVTGLTMTSEEAGKCMFRRIVATLMPLMILFARCEAS